MLRLSLSLICFHIAPDINGVASYAPIPESEIQEYHRHVEHLDQVLAGIEKYIYFAFAVLKQEEIVERMFTVVSLFDLCQLHN
jgi:hypothetical protein